MDGEYMLKFIKEKDRIKVLLFLLIFFSFLATPSFASDGKVQSSNIVGSFQQENLINIESQNYIDSYFSWNFQEINNTHWIATFSIDKNFWKNATTCNVLPTGTARQNNTKNVCFTNLCNIFSTLNLNCSNITKLKNDIANFSNYPLISITKEIQLPNKIIFNATSGQGSFYIIFPNGFKVNEKAEFGFDSTIISTSTTVPFYPNQRAICRDGNDRIHIAWLYNSTTIAYANNLIFWSMIFINSSTTVKGTPHISCDGNNITIAYEDVNLDGINVYISTDNGGSFALKTPVTSVVHGTTGGLVVERRGSNIYVVWQTATIGIISVNFINSTDGGLTWGSQQTLFQGVYLPKFSIFDNYVNPSIIVSGSGTSADRIFVVVEHDARDVDYYWYLELKYSINAGGSWTQKTVSSDTSSYSGHSLGYDDSPEQLFVSSSRGENIYAYNSSNLGVSWTASLIFNQIGKATNPSVTLDVNNENCVFFQADNTTLNRNNIAYVNRNNSAWNSTYTNVTTDFLRNQYPNTRWNYNANGVDFVYANGTASPYSITYDIRNCTYYIAPPPSDTCTYSGPGNWFININDNCTLSSANTVTGNIYVYATGSGYLNFQANQYAHAFNSNATGSGCSGICSWFYNNFRWIY